MGAEPGGATGILTPERSEEPLEESSDPEPPGDASCAVGLIRAGAVVPGRGRGDSRSRAAAGLLGEHTLSSSQCHIALSCPSSPACCHRAAAPPPPVTRQKRP